MYQLLTAVALGRSLAVSGAAVPACRHRCIDACPEIFDKCVVQYIEDPSVCWDNRHVCADFCAEHPCLHPPTNEDGTLVILQEDKTIITCAATACIDTCAPVLAACLQTPELTSQGSQLCQQQGTLCHTFCGQYPEAILFLNNDGSEIVFPVAGHDGVCLDTCDTTLETCSANANTFRDLYMCKYGHLQCLTTCHTPDTKTVNTRNDFACETLLDSDSEPIIAREADRCENAYKRCIASGNGVGRCKHELRICSGSRPVTDPEDDIVDKRDVEVCMDKCEPTLAACIRTKELTTQGPQLCYQQSALCSTHCIQHPKSELELNEASNEIVFPPPSAFGGDNTCWEAAEAQFKTCSAVAANVHTDVFNCKYERVLSLSLCYEAGHSEGEAAAAAEKIESCHSQYARCIKTPSVMPWDIGNGVVRCKNNLHACLGSLGTVSAGTAKAVPAIVTRQVNSGQAICDAEFTNCIAEGNAAGRCKHSQRICLSPCPTVVDRCGHVCADACPKILGNCKAQPPLAASSAFCENQDTNCEAYCAEYPCNHPNTVDNGTVIIFPPTFTPPIAMEATDNVATITVTAGTGPTVAPPILPAATAVPVKRQSQSCRDFCGEACRVQREVCEKRNLQSCGSQAQDCVGRCYGTWCGVFGWN